MNEKKTHIHKHAQFFFHRNKWEKFVTFWCFVYKNFSYFAWFDTIVDKCRPIFVQIDWLKYFIYKGKEVRRKSKKIASLSPSPSQLDDDEEAQFKIIFLTNMITFQHSNIYSTNENEKKFKISFHEIEF